MLEQERQRIEQLTAGWDDPTAAWGADEAEDGAAADQDQAAEQGSGFEAEDRPLGMAGNAGGPTYKCIALYSYTVSLAACRPRCLPACDSSSGSARGKQPKILCTY